MVHRLHKAGLFTIALILFSLPLIGQQAYWILLNDKPDVFNSLPALGPDALQNRFRQGIALDERDYPVSPTYIKTLENEGIEILMQSRWLNAVGAVLTPEKHDAIARLPFVKEIRLPAKSNHIAQASREIATDSSQLFLDQISLLGLTDMHLQGFTGKGVKLALFDNGFVRADSLPGLFPLFANGQVLATRDFVSHETEVFDPCVHCRHGTYVLSILAASMPGYLTGAAPGVSLILLRTENDSSETQQEEMNWVQAAEYADSLGAQIFSTSLGYYDFDDGTNYGGKLDGKTALITQAAQYASEKGIVVVNSAGNNGNSGINAPSDAPGVIAVGAVDRNGTIASFSSRGPTSDGRIKPDIVAMGKTNTYIYPNGSLRTGDGTSFSCPLISGFAACLMQANPQATATQIRDAILQSGDRYSNPDNTYGHGLPSASHAMELLNSSLEASDFGQVSADYRLLAYPNPASGDILLAFQPTLINKTWSVTVLDLTGKTIYRADWEVRGDFGQMKLPNDLSPGRYWVVIADPNSGKASWRAAVVVTE